MKTKRTKKGLAALLAICMALFAVPFTASAAGSVTLDLAEGDITITETGYKAAGATSETAYTGDYYIMQSNNGTQTSNTVSVLSGTHNITVDGLNIKPPEGRIAPFFVGGTSTKIGAANVTLILNSDNVFQSYFFSPGLAVSGDSTVTIGGTGSLTATGKNDSAGIGAIQLDGSVKSGCGTIIINSGTIIAQGASTSGVAGIGSISGGSSITINGGYVKATGGMTGGGNTIYGPGIGVDTDQTITINGGTVVASGAQISGAYGSAFRGAADIGGAYTSGGCKSATVIVNGGNVVAVNNRMMIASNNSNTYVPGSPSNSAGATLYRTAITLDGLDEGVAISSIKGVPDSYALNDMQTYTGGLLYLYLPENTRVTSVTLADGTVYGGSVTTSTDNNAAGTFTTATGPAPEDRSATITANATIPSPTYTVTIPSTVNAGSLVQKAADDPDKIKSTTFTVSASSIENLFDDKQVVVELSTADGTFELADGDNKLAYSVFNQAADGTAMTSGGTYAEFTAAGEQAGRIEIDQSEITRAGNYTGTMTFTISVEGIK